MVPACKSNTLKNMEKLKNIINQEVIKLFLVVWPPLGEDKIVNIDISFAFIFHNNPSSFCVITTDRTDMWTPHVNYEAIPEKIYSWSVFDERMNSWMKQNEDRNLEMEYYDVSSSEYFTNIVSSRVKSIEIVKLKNIPDPFGVKIIFENDFILSTPISDGNTVETSRFNKNSNLLTFQNMGALEFKNLFEI